MSTLQAIVDKYHAERVNYKEVTQLNLTLGETIRHYFLLLISCPPGVVNVPVYPL